MLQLAASDLVDLAARRRMSQLVGTARDEPVVLVHLDDIAPDTPASELDLLPAVLIGIGGASAQSARLTDVVVDDLAGAEALLSTIDAQPDAAVALCLLLRGGQDRTVAGGLVAESTTYSMLQASSGFRAWRAGRPPHDIAAGDEPPVLVSVADGCTTIQLNRPHRHNAVDTGLAEALTLALTDALTMVLDDPAHRVVLAGMGPSFSSGGDLDDFGRVSDVAVAHSARLARSSGHLVHLLGGHIDVRLHGACIGAGIEVPAFASRIVADRTARIALPELRFGLVPGAGGTVSLPRRIGRHRTAWLALSGTTIDASTALGWGLVDEVTGPA